MLTPSLLAGTRIMGKEIGAGAERPYSNHGDLVSLGYDSKGKEDGVHFVEGQSPQLGWEHPWLSKCGREATAWGRV